MSGSNQALVTLTAHPLQRIGAYALARLSGARDPAHITTEGFEDAVETMTEDAVTAALVGDSKVPEGFWLKCSFSFFPNAPMNHPGNAKKTRQAIEEAVRLWRDSRDPPAAPGIACVLCGRAGAAFYGKLDVPLAESDAYRNTTPRGHEGMALCRSCICSFYALPYGCRQTGGPAVALHSWDDDFLAKTVALQVSRTRRAIIAGAPERASSGREVVALRALRRYEEDVIAGVELMVFSNNNRGQTLEISSLEQPLAEWLRRSSRWPERRSGYRALLRAHHTPQQSALTALARNAFRDPLRIISTCVRYLSQRTAVGRLGDDARQLPALCFSYIDEVVGMNAQDLAEIKATADRVSLYFDEQTRGGKLNEFYTMCSRDSRQLRQWIQRYAVTWRLTPPKGVEDNGPLITVRGFELLFSLDPDAQAWFNRQVFLVAVLEKLHERNWRPIDAVEAAAELPNDDELGTEERQHLAGHEDEEESL